MLVRGQRLALIFVMPGMAHSGLLTVKVIAMACAGGHEAEHADQRTVPGAWRCGQSDENPAPEGSTRLDACRRCRAGIRPWRAILS